MDRPRCASNTPATRRSEGGWSHWSTRVWLSQACLISTARAPSPWRIVTPVTLARSSTRCIESRPGDLARNPGQAGARPWRRSRILARRIARDSRTRSDGQTPCLTMTPRPTRFAPNKTGVVDLRELALDRRPVAGGLVRPLPQPRERAVHLDHRGAGRPKLELSQARSARPSRRALLTSQRIRRGPVPGGGPAAPWSSLRLRGLW